MEPELKSNPAPDRGFTLIELLVVISVLAVLSVGATLAVSGRGTDSAASDRAWFETQFRALQDLAMQGRNSKGLNITPEGLGFARRTDQGWDIGDPVRRWQSDVTIANLQPRPGLDEPQIILLANGQTTAFNILFSGSRGASRSCRSDGWTGLKCGGD
ncbi:type II secretion system protein [Sulfitobacter sp. PR48]|uniref:Type II secretion system protein n=1 Tax=Sulfitobacter porphyrae TaxID=1246864 RepID=A0ABW2AYR2_9RHOB|nr:type II secretion system protein [Sulfitobacter sp. PR48]MDD9719828.1 type II secretion system protein [Sulfitobacter sp. PR48]GLT08815.1 hypothetical protein GCM10007928_10470 [Sulfitobacter porphyrae]